MTKSFSRAIVAVSLMTLLVAGGRVALGAPDRGTLEGYITQIDESWVEIENYGGQRALLLHHKDILFYIDDTPAELTDFKPGMEVYAKYRDFSIYHLESYSTENLGYISPGSKVRSGVVTTLDRDQMTISLIGGGQGNYFLSPATIVVRQGRAVPASTIAVGDNVRLYFDEVDTSVISRLHIQGYSEKVKALYRGTLDGADSVENVVTLKDLEVFREGKWQHHRDVDRMEYTLDNTIYMAGAPVAQNNLKYFKGRTVYAAVKDHFGREKIEKLVIKNQYEALYSEKVEEIHWYSSAMELGNRRNIGINDGTIFIRGGRLVDKDSIAPGVDAHIVVDGGAQGASANVVYVYSDDMNNSPLGQNYLYAGRLGMAVENRMVLEDFYILNRHEWESYRDDREFYYDDDTAIYDLVRGKEIDTEEFYSGDYSVDDAASRRRGPGPWYGYIYTDGDRIVGMSLMETMDSLLRQRITLGIVDKIEEDTYMGKTLYLRDARDWSHRNEAWMPKGIPVRVRVEDTLMVRGDAAIDVEDLKTGDTVYIVREDYEGKFLQVK